MPSLKKERGLEHCQSIKMGLKGTGLSLIKSVSLVAVKGVGFLLHDSLKPQLLSKYRASWGWERQGVKRKEWVQEGKLSSRGSPKTERM